MRVAYDAGKAQAPLWMRAVLLWALIALTAIVLLWTGASLKRSADQTFEESRARQSVTDLSDSYAKQLQSSIEQIDQLTMVISRLPAGTNPIDMRQIFKDLPSYDWFNPLLIDSNGIVQSARTSLSIGSSVADTQFFKYHHSTRSTALRINLPEPGVGRLKGQQMVRFSRRLDDEQGRFVGIVSLSLLPAQLTEFGGNLALRDGDIIGIQFNNGQALVQRVIGTETNDLALPPPPEDSVNQTLFAEVRLPGNLMYASWSPLAHYPLRTVVAISHRNALRSFDEARDLYNLLQYAGTSLIILLCIAGGLLQFRRDTRAHRQHQVSSTFRLAVDASREELYMLSPVYDRDGRIVNFLVEDCNGQAMRMSARERGELVGKMLSDIMSAGSLDASNLFFHTAMTDGFAEQEAFIYREGPQKNCWVHARAVRADLGLAVTLRDITEVKEKEQQLQQLALTDALTHLPNRHWMNQQLPVMMQAAQQQRRQFAALFIDLDNFKTINDTLGHKAGDAFLKAVARILRESVRKDDYVLRLGGDEFMILLHELHKPHIALEIAAHLLAKLREIDTIDTSNHLAPRASIGVALYPDHATTPEGLVQAADIAMYEAKRSGKDRVTQYSARMLERLSERINMESALQHAIPGGQLLLYLQPRASAVTGELVGFEALVRWQHPDMGLVSPQRFIPLAEESHLIVEVGNWVAESACETLSRWRETGKKIVPLSINVSARQLRDSEFRTQLGKQMQTHRIKASDIAIELTESTMIGEDDVILQELGMLAEMGLELMIDDFGTGYSSLARLQSLQVDVLKIDQSFVRNLSAGGEGIVLCQAMTQMGKTLGLTVVAEGVETTEQLRLLQLMGCDEIQGFIASPPVPVETALTMLEGPPFFAPLADIRHTSTSDRYFSA